MKTLKNFVLFIFTIIIVCSACRETPIVVNKEKILRDSLQSLTSEITLYKNTVDTLNTKIDVLANKETLIQIRYKYKEYIIDTQYNADSILLFFSNYDSNIN